MPRKKTRKLKRKIMAARRRQETPEQRADRLEKSRIRTALRRASETLEEREVRLAGDRRRMSATRKNLKERAKCVNLKLQLNQSLSSTLTDPYVANLRGRELSDYKTYLRYHEQLKRAANDAAIRRSQESPEKRSLRLEKCRIRAAAIRACESMEERAFRLHQNRERIRETRMQAKLQSVTKSAPHRTRNKSQAQQVEHSPPPSWETKINVINGIQPKFRGGFCPKTAGNYNSIKEIVDIECDVEVEEGAEPLEMIQESMVLAKYFLPLQMKNKLVTEKTNDQVRSVVEKTLQLENPKHIADKIENKYNSPGEIDVLENLGLIPAGSSNICLSDGQITFENMINQNLVM